MSNGITNVDADHRTGLHSRDFAETLSPEKVLAGADRDADGLRAPRHGFDVIRRNRIFQPHGLDRRQFAGEADDILRVVAPVALDGEIRVRPQRFAHGFHTLDNAPVVAIGEPSAVGIVTWLAEARVRLDRYAISLELECGPAPLFGPG